MYYTYAYLREDGTPYYIGKGQGKRINQPSHSVRRPPLDRRIFLKTNLTEEEAFRHEKYMIAVLGRKDLGTGILRNLTDGGEGPSGVVRTAEQREQVRQRMLNLPEEQREHLRQIALNMPQEQRDKIAESLRGTISPKRKKYVLHYKNGETEIVNGLYNTSKERGWSVGNLYNLMNDKHKSKSMYGIIKVTHLETAP